MKLFILFFLLFFMKLKQIMNNSNYNNHNNNNRQIYENDIEIPPIYTSKSSLPSYSTIVIL